MIKKRFWGLFTISILTLFFSFNFGMSSHVNAADYYINRYSDGVSVWVTNVEKYSDDYYVAVCKYVYPSGNYKMDSIVFQQNYYGNWYYRYTSISGMRITKVQDDGALNDILYFVLNN
jgi:hypothetical protein